MSIVPNRAGLRDAPLDRPQALRNGVAGCQNRGMLNTLKALAAPAVMQRLTLLLNHVLASEAAATYRLKSHSGRRIVVHLDRWPACCRRFRHWRFWSRPAGLLEWQDAPSRRPSRPTCGSPSTRRIRP